MTQPDYGAGDRADSLHRSFAAMRSALRDIIYSNGDCSRLDEPKDSPLCDCPTCIAKRALEGEEDWRFQGYNPGRRKSMPREAAMNDAWQHYFKHAAGSANNTTAPMDAVLAKILFGEHGGPKDVTSASGTRDGDRRVARDQRRPVHLGHAGSPIQVRARAVPTIASDERRLIRARDAASPRAETAEANRRADPDMGHVAPANTERKRSVNTSCPS